MPTTMTRAEYARHRGVSKPCVTQWADAGRLVLTADGKVDVAASDARLTQTVNTRGGKRTRGAAGGVQDGAEPRPGNGSLPGPGTLTHARTRQAQARGALDALAYRERIRDLVETAEVRRAVGGLAPAVNQFHGIPDRLAARLAAESDPRKCHDMLADEIDAACLAVADFSRQLIARFEGAKK